LTAQALEDAALEEATATTVGAPAPDAPAPRFGGSIPSPVTR
jgi:hypothetical protein